MTDSQTFAPSNANGRNDLPMKLSGANHFKTCAQLISTLLTAFGRQCTAHGLWPPVV